MINFRRKKREGFLTPVEHAFRKIEPGMSIFLGTGVGEPRTLIGHLMESGAPNLQDLELVQLVSFGQALGAEHGGTRRSRNFRLKTFFSGWVASEAISEGRADLIPCRFSRIHRHILSGRVHIDAAFVQVAPPDDQGYCSLGLAVDVARYAMEKASIVIGEVHPDMPFTFGDTLVHMDEFDCLVESSHGPICLDRWPCAPVHEKVAENIASLIGDGSCLSFSTGPLFEALGKKLMDKRGLGIHSLTFTDALMDLVRSGAVTNRNKGVFRGKSLTSYAMGSRELYRWLDRNPLVEFQGIERVFHPSYIGKNPDFMAVLPARKVDLTGRIALHTGKRNVAAGPGEAMNFVNGAEISDGGLAIFGLPSRNRAGQARIVLNVESCPSLFSLREAVDIVATEYGIADLAGKSVRERAQALIEIAHPDDRARLVEQAKEAKLLYRDQIFLPESARLYPSDIAGAHVFKEDLKVRFRAIRPSDEEQMRRLFYRFSDEAVYCRYFSPVKTMPHARMQEYVNIDYCDILSIVGLVGDPGEGRIIAEARFARRDNNPYADIAFTVDESCQGAGIATHMYKMLARFAKNRGLKGFTADILASNKPMLRVLEKVGRIVKSRIEDGVCSMVIDLD